MMMERVKRVKCCLFTVLRKNKVGEKEKKREEKTRKLKEEKRIQDKMFSNERLGGGT
jgi:hypothetical protein